MAEVKFEEVRQGLADLSLTYVDVRNREELQNDGKIKGSQNVPHKFICPKTLLATLYFFSRYHIVPEIEQAFSLPDDEFANKYGFLKPAKDAALVCGCLAGRRAAAAVDKLKNLGYGSGLRWYSGSFQDWRANGGELE